MKWTHVFAEELVAIADERPDIVGITAAMAEPTGIAALARKYPERVYDVGIAEQHAVTSAAGLAMGGLHPVVAVYATFLNRAFDQVLLDVAMHGLPVTFVLDRAGITGPDGPSHYGIWDMSVFGVVPGLRIAAPRDAATLREELREAVAVDDGPTIVRFPTGSVAGRPAGAAPGRPGRRAARGRAQGRAAGRGGRVRQAGHGGRRADRRAGVRRDGRRPALGAPGADRAGRPGRRAPPRGDRWRTASGPAGSATRSPSTLRDAGVDVPLRDFGVPAGFHPHGSRAEILAALGLTAQDIARDVTEWVSRSGGRRANASTSLTAA